MATRRTRESELWLLGICVLHGRTWRDYFAQGKCFLWRKGFAELSRRAQQVEGPWYKTRKVNYFQVKYLMFHLIYSCALNMVHIFFQGLGICGISIFLCWLNRIWAAATFPFFFVLFCLPKNFAARGKCLQWMIFICCFRYLWPAFSAFSAFLLAKPVLSCCLFLTLPSGLWIIQINWNDT